MKKNKLKVLTILAALLLCLAGCSNDDVAPIQGAGAANSGSNAITNTYNYLGNSVPDGPYESYTLNPDMSVEYTLVIIGTGWVKGVGTYSINQSTNEITMSLDFNELSAAFTGSCGISFTQTAPNFRVDDHTILMPHTFLTTLPNANFVKETISGLTAPDLSADPNICP